jgi:hypothetical protein
VSLKTIWTLVDVENVTTDGEGPVVDAGLHDEFVAEVKATEDVAGTLDVKIVDSFDGGTTWHDWIVFTQLATTGTEVKKADRPPAGDVKAVYDLTGGTWDVRVKLAGRPTR